MISRLSQEGTEKSLLLMIHTVLYNVIPKNDDYT